MSTNFGWSLPAGVTLDDIDELDNRERPVMPPMSLEGELAMIDACFEGPEWVDPWLVGLPPAPVASNEPFLPDFPDEQGEQPQPVTVAPRRLEQWNEPTDLVLPALAASERFVTQVLSNTFSAEYDRQTGDLAIFSAGQRIDMVQSTAYALMDLLASVLPDHRR